MSLWLLDRSAVRIACGTLLSLVVAATLAVTTPRAQTPSQPGLVVSRNVNMMSGTKWPTGDPYLQRQNEPSIAVSSRNPLHLFGGANDYRTVDLPFVAGAEETGDAWLGTFFPIDGRRWTSTLMPPAAPCWPPAAGFRLLTGPAR